MTSPAQLLGLLILWITGKDRGGLRKEWGVGTVSAGDTNGYDDHMSEVHSLLSRIRHV